MASILLVSGWVAMIANCIWLLSLKPSSKWGVWFLICGIVLFTIIFGMALWRAWELIVLTDDGISQVSRFHQVVIPWGQIGKIKYYRGVKAEEPGIKIISINGNNIIVTKKLIGFQELLLMAL